MNPSTDANNAPAPSPGTGITGSGDMGNDMGSDDRGATLDRGGSSLTIPRFTTARPFGLALLITGIIGWVAAGILILEKLELYRNPDHVTSCDINPWVSCGQVME